MSEKFLTGGTEYINSLLSLAISEGEHEIKVSGSYEIKSTVFIPSGMTVILENCHLRLADGAMCQMFCNEHCLPKAMQDVNKPDRDIHIIGIGKAILDGGNYNGLSEKNSLSDGMPHISQNNMILFCNVDGFSIENTEIIRQRWWAVNLLYCRNGCLKNIRFEADYTRYDKDGNIVVGLDRDDYASTRVKNADGIDLRVGCHDILIENIGGFTEDDSIAITGLYGSIEKLYYVPGLSTDIHDITIHNVRTAAFCTQVRILNQSGVKLYNISVDGVFDESKDCKYYKGRGVASVRIGDVHLYGTRHSTPEETYNIRIKNVHSRAAYALRFAGSMSNITYDDIHGFDGCPCIIEDLSI